MTTDQKLAITLQALKHIANQTTERRLATLKPKGRADELAHIHEVAFKAIDQVIEVTLVDTTDRELPTWKF